MPSSTRPCSDCGAALETPLACHECGSVHELAAETTPFDLFGIEPTFDLDLKDLRRRLVRFSRLVHPDFFGDATGAVHDRAERNSAALNEAFGVLSDDLRRAEEMLRELGGPDESAERSMPQPFLMEVLEWNERLETARDEPNAEARADLSRLHIALQRERESLFEAIAAVFGPPPGDAEQTAPGGEALTDVRRKLNAVRYLDRTLAQIEALRLDLAAAS